MPDQIVHLHNHSSYSLLDGLSPVTAMAERAKELEQPAIALTDHGVLFGAVKFYEACESAGIKSIIGIEPYISEGSMLERSGENFHLTLLAMNDVGYRNLLAITTEAHLHGFYRKPRIDKDYLAAHSDGLICLSGCMASELSTYILNDDQKKAYELHQFYKDIFGDRYYIELQNHGLETDARLSAGLAKLADESGVSVVITNDSHYVRKDQAEAHEVMLCVQTQTVLSNPKRMNYGTYEYFLKSYDEMQQLFPERAEGLSNSIEVANRCNLQLDFNRLPLPCPPIPGNQSPIRYLKRLTWEGLKQRYSDRDTAAIERARYELGVIDASGYAEYFLIVMDILQHARSQNIACGVRGSVGGSIVAYCIGITEVDPLKYKLTFERFLNPDRVTMPDCDQDFSDIYRDTMVQYTRDTYGTDNVTQIITFGTMAAKMSVRDVCRAMEIPYDRANYVANLIPFKNADQSKITIQQAIDQVPDLRSLYHQDDTIHKVLDICRELEGVQRHASTHAAGVVVSARPLIQNVPLYTAPKMNGVVTTQFAMEEVEKIGLLKIDFLGLRTLTVLQRTCELTNVPLDAIPYDDPVTYKLLATGNTFGVFQIESPGMQALMKRDRPRTVQEVAVLVALYRPGPMQFIDDYVDRHHGKQKIEYPHPILKEALSDTFGVPIFQEQIMKIVQLVAGFSAGKADIIRKGMGKKKHEIIHAAKTEFLEGAQQAGTPLEDAERIWQIIVPHGGYSFNLAHAIQYAIVSCKTAYMKAKYPLEYMLCYLSAEHGNLEKVSEAIGECRRIGIEILPPNVNHGFADFTQEGNAIRYGLSALKGLGDGVADAIIQEREKHGNYRSFSDFHRRLGSKDADKGVLEALAKSGAMDEFGERRQLVETVPELIKRFKKGPKGDIQQETLFDLTGLSFLEVPLATPKPATRKQRLDWERETTGAYLSEDILSDVMKLLDQHKIRHLSSITPEMEGATVRVAGLIVNVSRHTTKKGDPMAFLRVQDATSIVRVTVFPRTYARSLSALQENTIVVIDGKVQVREERAEILADHIALLSERHDEEQILPQDTFTILLELSMTPTGDRDRDNGVYEGINTILKNHPGPDEVKFFINGRGEYPLRCKTTLVDSRLEDELRALDSTLQMRIQ